MFTTVVAHRLYVCGAGSLLLCMSATSGHGECFVTAGILCSLYPFGRDLLLSCWKCCALAHTLQRSSLPVVLLEGENGSLTLEAPAPWVCCRGHWQYQSSLFQGGTEESTGGMPFSLPVLDWLLEKCLLSVFRLVSCYVMSINEWG